MGPFLYACALVLLGTLALLNARYNGTLTGCLPRDSRVNLCLQVYERPQVYITQAGRTYLRFTARLLAAGDSAGSILSGSGAPRRIGVHEKIQVWLAEADDSLTRRAADRFPTGQIFYTQARPREATQDPDYAQYLARQGLFCSVFVYRWSAGPLRPTLIDRVRNLRYSLAARWESDRPAADREKALLEGLCLGYKANMDKDLKEAYSVAGASHILAVSGLHVGALYATLVWLLGWMGRKRAPCVAVCCIWIYAVMVGLSASVVRSSLMLTLHAAARATGRHNQSMNAWAAAAFVLLVVKPSNLYDWGFQLSFAAVGSLLLFFPLLRNLLSVRNGVLRFFWELFCCSVAVQLGTLWLTAGLFGSVSPVGLPANLLVIPLGTLIIYVFVVFLAGCALAPLTPWLCDLTAHVMLSLAGWLNRTVLFAASLPGATLYLPSDGLMQAILLWAAVYMYMILRLYSSES